MPTVLRADSGEVILDVDELGGIGIWERMEQRGVNHAVDGGGGADAASAMVAMAMRENPGDRRSMRTA